MPIQNWNNMYWGSYKQIEKRLIELSHSIYFDDTQLNVYSTELSDMLLSICSKIESISKDIYQKHFWPFLLDQQKIPKSYVGKKAFSYTNWTREKWIYDYECIREFYDVFQLKHKVVNLNSPHFHFSEYYEHIKPFSVFVVQGEKWEFFGGEWEIVKGKIIYPDSPSYDNVNWNKSYQAIKHNYAESISIHGNLKNVIVSLAALYLLIVYNEFYMSGRFAVTGIDTYEFFQNMGSDIFSVGVFSNLFERLISKCGNSNEEQKVLNRSVLVKIYTQSRYRKLMDEIHFHEQKCPDIDIVEFINQKSSETKLRDIELMQHKSKLISLSSETIGSTVILLNENRENPYDWYNTSSFDYEQSKFKNHRAKVLSEISIGSKVRIDEFSEYNEGEVIDVNEHFIVMKTDKYKQYSLPLGNIYDIHILN